MEVKYDTIIFHSAKFFLVLAISGENINWDKSEKFMLQQRIEIYLM